MSQGLATAIKVSIPLLHSQHNTRLCLRSDIDSCDESNKHLYKTKQRVDSVAILLSVMEAFFAAMEMSEAAQPDLPCSSPYLYHAVDSVPSASPDPNHLWAHGTRRHGVD